MSDENKNEPHVFGINEQPPQPKTNRNGFALDVFKWFFTIQGEGMFSGRPAVFLRLAGCNLQCPLCDTIYTGSSAAGTFKVDELKKHIDDTWPKNLKRSSRLLVITGGEPLRQNIVPFVKTMLRSGWSVQIETNGTLIDDEWLKLSGAWPYRLTTCISPKTAKVSKSAYALNSANHGVFWKYVLEAGHVGDDGLPTRVLGYDREPAKVPEWVSDVYVQPIDMHDGNEQPHLDAAIDSCMKHGHRLCVQSHKLGGLE